MVVWILSRRNHDVNVVYEIIYYINPIAFQASTGTAPTLGGLRELVCDATHPNSKLIYDILFILCRIKNGMVYWIN